VLCDGRQKHQIESTTLKPQLQRVEVVLEKLSVRRFSFLNVEGDD